MAICLSACLPAKNNAVEELNYNLAESSMFYEEPYDAMAAFDYDTNNFAAAYADTFPNWFVVSVSRPILVETIELTWHDYYNYATDFEIYGFSDNEWILLAKETDFQLGNYTLIYRKTIETPITITQLKLLVNKTEGQERLLLRKFELNVGYVGKGYDTVKELVDEILSGPFSNVLPHQKIVLFMDWMDDNIIVELGEADSIDTINRKRGACGTLSQLLRAMAHEVGLEARGINIYNYPSPGLGHSVVEIMYDDKWRLYDPTFGAYYVTNSEDVKNRLDPNVASFEEIRKNPDLVDDCGVVLNVKRLYRNLFPTINGVWMAERRGVYTSSDAYRYADPAGPIGADRPYVFPASFDLSQDSFQYGEKDFSSMDLVNIYNAPAGMNIIGASGYLNSSHRYAMEGLSPGNVYVLEFGITYSHPETFVINIEVEDIKLACDAKLSIDSKERTETEVFTIQFTPEKDAGSIVLRHDYLESGEVLYMDYIKIYKKR